MVHTFPKKWQLSVVRKMEIRVARVFVVHMFPKFWQLLNSRGKKGEKLYCKGFCGTYIPKKVATVSRDKKGGNSCYKCFCGTYVPKKVASISRGRKGENCVARVFVVHTFPKKWQLSVGEEV